MNTQRRLERAVQTYKSVTFPSACLFSAGGGVGAARGSGGSLGAGVDVLDTEGAGEPIRGTGDATRDDEAAPPCSAAAFCACLFLS